MRGRRRGCATDRERERERGLQGGTGIYVGRRRRRRNPSLAGSGLAGTLGSPQIACYSDHDARLNIIQFMGATLCCCTTE